MSYILDALTKAAKQRDRHAPVLQRLLSPAPVAGAGWSASSGRLVAALVLNAVLLIMLLVMWLRPIPLVAPPSALVEPRAELPAEKTPPREREAFVAPSPKPSSTVSPTPASTPTGPRRSTQTTRRTQEPTVAPPVVPDRPLAPPKPAGLRLEALIYADRPAERMVFINGRKYVEGDSIEGRLQVQEIQEEGVVLSEQGRRFTLRVAH